MNKSELDYERNLLQVRKVQDKDMYWRFGSVGFKLANRCFYYPDFYVVTSECIEIHEVKGYWEDDALVKWKVFVEMYPEFKHFTAKKINGVWKVKEW